MEIEPITLIEPDPSEVDSLVSSNDPDDLSNEQTWPTEEEMSGMYENIREAPIPDATESTTPRIKRVPKGTSEYQAAWIIDESDGDEGDEETCGDAVEMNASKPNDEEEMQDLIVEDEDLDDNVSKSANFQDLDAEEEERQ